MSDWKDRVADALVSGAPSREQGSGATPDPIARAFDELSSGLTEALEHIGGRAGLSLTPDTDAAGSRLRWQYLTRSLMLRLDRDDGRVILSVTTDRDYDHAELCLEGGRLVAHQDGRSGDADTTVLIEAFATRFLLDSPKETPKP